MSKIYTKTGDNGETHLYGGVRVKKNSKIIRLLGEIDELNSFLGFAWNACEDDTLKDALKNIQIKLYKIGAELAGSKEFAVENKDVIELENFIDEIFGDKEFEAFARPGERGEFSSRIHLCRTICRKAERSAVKFAEDCGCAAGDCGCVAEDCDCEPENRDREPRDRDLEPKNCDHKKFKYILQYLNRLSDLLFAIAEIE